MASVSEGTKEMTRVGRAGRSTAYPKSS